MSREPERAREHLLALISLISGSRRTARACRADTDLSLFSTLSRLLSARGPTARRCSPSRAARVRSETIDATTDRGIVQPLTIRLSGFDFLSGRIHKLVILPKRTCNSAKKPIADAPTRRAL